MRAKTRTRLYCAAGMAALALLGACGTNQVTVRPAGNSFPAPLVSKIPLVMGVWYGDDFSNHEFSDITKSKAKPDWIVKTGQAQVRMWDVLLGGMFEKLVHLSTMPSPDGEHPGVDAVLIPPVDELQYALPANTNVQVYVLWMRYPF